MAQKNGNSSFPMFLCEEQRVPSSRSWYSPASGEYQFISIRTDVNRTYFLYETFKLKLFSLPRSMTLALRGRDWGHHSNNLAHALFLFYCICLPSSTKEPSPVELFAESGEISNVAPTSGPAILIAYRVLILFIDVIPQEKNGRHVHKKSKLFTCDVAKCFKLILKLD